MTQYNNIAVFKAKKTDNPKAPAFNVSIEFADGSKWKGGLWQRTSKNGVTYLSGNLETDTGAPQGQMRAKPKAEPEDPPFPEERELVDW